MYHFTQPFYNISFLEYHLVPSELNRNFVDSFVLCFRNLKEYICDEEYLGNDENDKYVGTKCLLKLDEKELVQRLISGMVSFRNSKLFNLNKILSFTH